VFVLNGSKKGGKYVENKLVRRRKVETEMVRRWRE
jgi:GH24 family phage-related lysozyme (muramidase)